MALAFGSLTASKIYLGATEINLAYLGATQVYTSGPVVSYLLDDYSGSAVGYSLRNLSSSWTSSDVVEVRRSSDNATLGFTATEVSDGTMLAWVGTGGTDNGFVTTWYDQSGNAENAVQATTTKQPKIVNAGAAVVENSKPALSFDGGDYLDDTFAAASFTNAGFVVARSPQGDFFFDDDDTVNASSLYAISDTALRYNNSGGGSAATTHTVPSGTWNNQNLSYFIKDGSGGDATVGVNSSSTTSANSGVQSLSGVTIGAAADGGTALTGTMQEVIVYASNQSANVAGIKSNINTEYTIY